MTWCAPCRWVLHGGPDGGKPDACSHIRSQRLHILAFPIAFTAFTVFIFVEPAFSNLANFLGLRCPSQLYCGHHAKPIGFLKIGRGIQNSDHRYCVEKCSETHSDTMVIPRICRGCYLHCIREGRKVTQPARFTYEIARLPTFSKGFWGAVFWPGSLYEP